MVQIYGQKILGIHFISSLHVGAKSALLRFIFLPTVSKQASRLLSCSSFSAKGLTRPKKSRSHGIRPVNAPQKAGCLSTNFLRLRLPAQIYFYLTFMSGRVTLVPIFYRIKIVARSLPALLRYQAPAAALTCFAECWPMHPFITRKINVFIEKMCRL